MPESRDLTPELGRLPPEMVSFAEMAGRQAARDGRKLYLVGGVVRDLLLGRANFDLDLVAEGDAVPLARRLAEATSARLTVHGTFKTAKLRWKGWSVDLATLRSETYSRPGALPCVEPGTIETDLFRRDLTVNAMAIELTAGHYGSLIDLYGGLDDLKRKLIRVLHDRSFTDDATRIWRSLRYEQRLGFHLERKTRRLLVRDLPMLGTVSGDRIRHELDLVFNEDCPERALSRAGKLGVLRKLHPSLTADAWLARKFKRARRLADHDYLQTLYLALLTYRLVNTETAEIIDRLNLPRSAAQVLADSAALRGRLHSLADPELGPHQIYNLLRGYSPAAILASRISSDSALVRSRTGLYLDRLRHIKPTLSGNDLIKMGAEPGPRLKGILQQLLKARIDGRVRTPEGEAELAKYLIKAL